MKIKKSILFFILVTILFSGCSAKNQDKTPGLIKAGDSRLIRGNNFLKLGKNRQALLNYYKAYESYSLMDNIEGCASSLTGSAIVYSRLDKEKQSLAEMEKAEFYYELTKNKKKKNSFYITKGLILLDFGHTKKAMENFLKAEKNGDKSPRLKLSMAMAFIKEKKIKKAENFIKTISSSEKENNSFFFYTKGLLSLENKDLPKARKNFLQALDIDKKQGDTSKIASDLEQLFMVELKAQNREQALNYLKRAVKIYEIMNNIKKTEKLNKLKNSLT